MTRLVRPVVVFGRRSGSGGLPGSYRILTSVAGDRRRALLAQVITEGIAPSFAWRPHADGAGRHAAAFALWGCDADGVVVARILDLGPDELDRPHQVRIEATLLEPSDLRVDADGVSSPVAGLLDPAAWPTQALPDDATEVAFTLGVPSPGPSPGPLQTGSQATSHSGSQAVGPSGSQAIGAALREAPSIGHLRLLVAERGCGDWSAGSLVELPLVRAHVHDASTSGERTAVPAPGAQRAASTPGEASGRSSSAPRWPDRESPPSREHPPERSSTTVTTRFAGWLVAFLLAVALGALAMRHMALRTELREAVLAREEVTRSAGAALAAQVAVAARLENDLAVATAARARADAERAEARRLAVAAEEALHAADPEGVRRENLLLRQLLRAQIDHLRDFTAEQSRLVDEQLGSSPAP